MALGAIYNKTKKVNPTVNISMRSRYRVYEASIWL